MMKKILLLLLLVCGVLYGKDIAVLSPHVTVTAKPSLARGSRLLQGPYLGEFRCTNHTNQPLVIELTVEKTYSRSASSSYRVRKKVMLLPGMINDVSVFFPSCINDYTNTKFSVTANPGVRVKFTAGELEGYASGDNSSLISPSFRPDYFEYLFERYRKAPMPVAQWPTDSRAYSPFALVVLDSADHIPPAVNTALRLAAARGTRVVVLVRGDAPWPHYAGKEVKGKIFKEEIGFGSWVVIRTQAVDSNPKWKEFVRKKHALSGKYKAYNALQWQEGELHHYLKAFTAPLHNCIPSVEIPPPPIPLLFFTLVLFAFVIIIGPVNYFVLKSKNKELWCLVTIPVLSLLFTGAVIIGVMVKEGFDSKGKGSVETYLDQQSGLAAARGSFALYSPVSVGTFRFNADDLLYFRNPGAVRGENTEEQTFSSALLPSRTSISYTIGRSGFISEKIAVTEKNGGVEVVNGLGVGIKTLYLTDSKGALFKLASPLEAGARVALESIPKLPAKVGAVAPGNYRAELAAPFFIKPGVEIDQYEHQQTLYGRWR